MSKKKLTKSKLRKLVKEELQNVLSEVEQWKEYGLFYLTQGSLQKMMGSGTPSDYGELVKAGDSPEELHKYAVNELGYEFRENNDYVYGGYYINPRERDSAYMIDKNPKR